MTLYAEIAALLDDARKPERLPGWATVEKANLFAAIVFSTRPETSVVIGVYGGRDTIPIAMAHKHWSFGKVIAIDPWLAAASIEGQDAANTDWWKDQSKHDYAFRHFMEALKETGTAEYVEVKVAKSDNVEIAKGIDFLVIDGNHGPQVLKDVDRFVPLVRPGGFVYLDDLNWVGNNVMHAQDFLMKLGFKKLYNIDTGAMFQKV
jgi:predicted O-methyltransferase YrrM